jgi:hypothetical protein
MKVFDSGVLRHVFGRRRGEVAGIWRKLQNDELRNLYFLFTVSRIIMSRLLKWIGHVIRIGAKKNACRIPAENREEKRPLEKPRSKRVNILKWYRLR